MIPRAPVPFPGWRWEEGITGWLPDFGFVGIGKQVAPPADPEALAALRGDK